eukprot:TRINITY_DN4555_c0_g1_i6.p1 TRINITY_DN4555_c0_g1~~TRINITY_DN4555_c0_g1_i6.p1  ORF type:complete len:137 (-),score=20.47 TRINITY_DN4555_c0_g1_i6:25-435(-)
MFVGSLGPRLGLLDLAIRNLNQHGRCGIVHIRPVTDKVPLPHDLHFISLLEQLHRMLPNSSSLGPRVLTQAVLDLVAVFEFFLVCLLYTSDAADEEDSVDLGGRRIIKKKKKVKVIIEQHVGLTIYNYYIPQNMTL